MATPTYTDPSTLPSSGADIDAEPLANRFQGLHNFLNEAANIDEANVDLTSTNGLAGLSTAQTITGLKSFSNTSAAAGGVRTAGIFQHNPASGTAADNDGVEIIFRGDDDDGNTADYGEIECVFTDTAVTGEDSDFFIKALVAATARNVLSVGSSGTVFNEDSQDIDFRIETDNIANGFSVDAGLDTFSFGAAAVDDQFVKIATPTATHTATTNTYALNVQPGGAQTIPSGTTAYVGSVNIEEPNITATGTVTNAFTLRVGGAPTEGGTTNYALWVDAGASQLDGTLGVGGALNLSTVAAAGEDTDKFLVLDSSGNVDYRSGSDVLSDIGGTSGGATLSWSTDDTIVTVTGSNAMQGEANLKFSSGQVMTVSSGSASLPQILVENTANDATSGVLKFNVNKGADGSDGDDLGRIECWGYDDGTPSTQQYATILGEIADASSGSETGKLSFFVAENDGTATTAGLTLTGSTATDGEIDVTIGAGAASVVTVPGHIDLEGDIDVNGTLEADAITIGGSAIGSIYSPVAGHSSIATVGTITTGTWQSSTVIASAYLDTDTAHLTTTQTFTGDKTFTGTVTVGVDDTGKDVKFFGASAGAYMEWDESEDQLRIMGASADATTSTGKLLLATSLTDINANDVLGKIDFQAPHETGTDATAIAASIQAVAQGTFAADLNATDLIFYTGHSEAATEKFRITSQGELGIGGANYGTDGQVLTSTGAGTAPAWEDVSASSTFSADTVVSNGYGLTVGSAASDRQAVNGVVCETQILGTGDADSAFAIGRWGNNASSALLYMYKSRGGSIGGAGTVLNDNDRIGQIIFCGDDSTDYQVAAGRIWCEVDVGTVSENVLGGAVCISTNDGGSGSGDTERFRIHANGNFTGSSSADISDSRLKENVATLSGSLAKINQLRGIEFTWKTEAKKDTDKHYGFLAQEVESIIPTVVWDKSVHDITAQAATTYTDGDTIPDGKSIGDVKTAAIEGKAFKSLHYSGLIPVLVEAIKELTARVEALEA